MPPNDALDTKLLIVIIDDDESCREAMASLIKSLGFTVEAFRSAPDFLASPLVRKASCLIADINMPRMSGVELHQRLLHSGYPIPTILITAYPDEGIRARALADGVIGYLSKPCNEDALLACVRMAVNTGQV